ncbi:kinase-like domain-containing protein [Pelagophyceae sp. CCMP2097]|nr:kinase-like domain-containing protein [Pelagophyceae sp. CCMP2097]
MEAIQAAGGVPAEATPDALELLERRVFSVVSLYAPQFRSSKYFKSFVAFTWREAQPILSTYFHKFRTIGRGGFGCVYGCKTLTTGKMYALKEVDMKRMKQRKAQALCYSEHEVLKKLKSPFSVNLKYAFHERGKLILIIDLMMGGDLKYWLKEHGTFDATFLRYAAARTILALEAIHAIGFIHRDIKPENMLLDESGRVRISDLGLATRLSPSPRGVSGTPGYFAPEMLLGLHYDQRVDYWSFGCMVVECITGRCMELAVVEMPPDLGDAAFLQPEIAAMDAADFCSELLIKNPDKRLGAHGVADILSHQFFASLSWDAVRGDTMEPPFAPGRALNFKESDTIGSFVSLGDTVSCCVRIGKRVQGRERTERRQTTTFRPSYRPPSYRPPRFIGQNRGRRLRRFRVDLHEQARVPVGSRVLRETCASRFAQKAPRLLRGARWRGAGSGARGSNELKGP